MISVQKPITGMESTETDAPEGETRIDLVIRTSRIYRQVEAQWKQSHHHGSIDDPALLHSSQIAVLGGKS